MKITDQMLSAFLDAELAPEEMEKVRLALETDDDLVMRMAELSQVDQWVVEHAQQIDHTPVPAKIVALAQQIDAKHANTDIPTDNKVVQISKWQKVTSQISGPYSMAAGVALVVTVGMLSFSQQSNQTGLSQEVAAVLDNTLSGDTSYLAEGEAITAQLSFTNLQGQFCRQFQMVSNQGSSAQIACKHSAGWQVAVQSAVQGTQNSGDYQTASSNKQLDQMIDKMISGAPLDRAQEQQAIQLDWQSENK
ncbi:hypothetical protein [uncultured Paraglaciecola sp.]|uniref:anti-sigma factor family protein n=1 Tax=uncultured Paraglaciecola sp. TaxID=1765024 RepID=UPI0030D7FD67|tara:strand:+ start:44391 stop:45137 length:747 start_codon:yes stop_codon:yes gene_type:complete